ncbi:hypothetical protein [Paragemmobacter aquarius]|nr:hypothetical protein [Gemmobacter aquarius]
MMILNMKLGAATTASFLMVFAAGQAMAQTLPSQLAGSLEVNSSVGTVGWSDNATLALVTSATPDAARGWYAHYWNQGRSSDNQAQGTVTVSSGGDNDFMMGTPAAGQLINGAGNLDLTTVDAGDLLGGALTVSYALTPELDYVSTGSVTADMTTKGNASARGLGETLGYIDASSSNKTSLSLNELGYSDYNEPTVVPIVGATSETTAHIAGQMDSDGLISRVSYDGEISGITGTDLRIDNVTVNQTVRASANKNGADFLFSRDVGDTDLVLTGDLEGNGMSMFQTADRTAIAGGGVDRKISFFMPGTPE